MCVCECVSEGSKVCVYVCMCVIKHTCLASKGLIIVFVKALKN